MKNPRSWWANSRMTRQGLSRSYRGRLRRSKVWGMKRNRLWMNSLIWSKNSRFWIEKMKRGISSFKLWTRRMLLWNKRLNIWSLRKRYCILRIWNWRQGSKTIYSHRGQILMITRLNIRKSYLKSMKEKKNCRAWSQDYEQMLNKETKSQPIVNKWLRPWVKRWKRFRILITRN